MHVCQERMWIYMEEVVRRKKRSMLIFKPSAGAAESQWGPEGNRAGKRPPRVSQFPMALGGCRVLSIWASFCLPQHLPHCVHGLLRCRNPWAASLTSLQVPLEPGAHFIQPCVPQPKRSAGLQKEALPCHLSQSHFLFLFFSSDSP